jgi:hypothetical protein
MRNITFSSACLAFLARTWRRRFPFMYMPYRPSWFTTGAFSGLNTSWIIL